MCLWSRVVFYTATDDSHTHLWDSNVSQVYFFYPLWNGKYKIAIVERDVIFMKNNKKKQFIKSFAVQKQLEQNHFYAQKNEKKWFIVSPQ